MAQWRSCSQKCQYSVVEIWVDGTSQVVNITKFGKEDKLR